MEGLGEAGEPHFDAEYCAHAVAGTGPSALKCSKSRVPVKVGDIGWVSSDGDAISKVLCKWKPVLY